MRGKRARAIRYLEEKVVRLGERWAEDPTDENEAALDAAQAELVRIKKKGEPLAGPRNRPR